MGFLLWIGIGGQTARAQSVLNPGFETASLPPWTLYGTGTIGSVPHSGAYGLTMQANGGNSVAFQDIYGLNPGQTYVVSAWVLSSASTTATVALLLHDTQGNGTVTTSVVPGTSWQRISQAYTVTSNGAMRIHLYQYEGSETTYWDDVAVAPAPPPNGGFESGSLPPWTVYGTGAIGSIPHSGAYGLMLQANGGSSVAFQDLYGLIPGQTYVVSAWVAASQPTTATVALLLHDTQGNGTVASNIVPINGWQQIS